MLGSIWQIILPFCILPPIAVLIDCIVGLRARNRTFAFSGKRCEDFTVLVPIWGAVRYLENVDYLRQYGDRVVLCTTGDERPEFYLELQEIADTYGFRIFRDEPTRATAHRVARYVQRATSGTIRDRVIRHALRQVRTEFVVPLDADSTTARPIGEGVNDLRVRGFDIASIRILARNGKSSWLARLQQYEYSLAMRIRFIAPWMVSGACHIARTEVLRDVMERHSLFFQGNDVETGLIAHSLGYRVGHIPFGVLTSVPETFKPWFRQRLAWSGGEFRLFIVNFWYLYRHPFFWFYGGVVSIGATPARWYSLVHPGYPILVALALYVAVVLYVHWGQRSPWVLLMPLYTAFSSFIMTPIGAVWYLYMAIKDGNAGIILPRRRVHADEMSVSSK